MYIKNSIRRREQRKKLCPMRLKRLVTLRGAGAPVWILKTEQIALVFNRRGMKAPLFIGPKSELAQTLYDRHVTPVLGQ